MTRTRHDDERVTVTGRLVRTTRDAILMQPDGHGREIWLPRQHCRLEEPSPGRCEITLPAWLAADRDIDGDAEPHHQDLFGGLS